MNVTSDRIAEAARRVGLKARETTLLRSCLFARTMDPDGRFLALPSMIPSAERLIARGYLLRSPEQMEFDPAGLGVVVFAGPEQFERLFADAEAAP